MKLQNPFRQRFARFADNERGVAAVEFALILPLLLTLYLGSIEASSLFTVDRRVEVISTTLADLIARWNPNQGAIPTATLKDYFAAAEGILVPYPTDELTQVVSFLNVTSAGVATVAWSCGNNGGTARGINSSYPLEEKMRKLVTESNTTSGFLVASEVAYPYQPALGLVFTAPLNLQNEALFLPRFGQTLAAPASGCPT
jgi:Flp pilus assembly protein TadG